MGRAANLRAKLAPAFREAVAPKTQTPAPEALGLPGTVFLGIVFGAVFVGLLVLSQWLLTKWLGWQILLIFICLDGGLAFAGVWLWKGLFTKAKAEDASDPLSEKLLQGLMALGYSTVGFAALTAVLIHHKLLLTATGTHPHDAALTYEACNTYLWNLVSSIPVLNLTDALGWHRDLMLTNEPGRLLILAFKLTLVIPFLALCGVVIWERP